MSSNTVTDIFHNFDTALSDPAESAITIVPSNATILDQPPRSLYIGSTGNLTVRMIRTQQIVTFMNVPTGSFLPIRVDMVYANTTASSIVGIY